MTGFVFCLGWASFKFLSAILVLASIGVLAFERW